MSTFYYPNFSKLADKTVPVMREYCRKHGYAFFERQIEDESTDETKNIVSAGLWNLKIAIEILTRHEWIDLLFVCGVDSVITNLKKKPDVEKGIILTGSDWDGISTSQMVISNCGDALWYLEEAIIGVESGRYEHDQEFFKKNLSPIVFKTHQRQMNSYDHEGRLETFNPDQHWQEGDFLVHLAGLTLEQRMNRIDYWLGKAK